MIVEKFWCPDAGGLMHAVLTINGNTAAYCATPILDPRNCTTPIARTGVCIDCVRAHWFADCAPTRLARAVEQTPGKGESAHEQP